MANPQLENGYTRIANEILEEVTKLPLNGTQFRIVIAIWRYTYGFQRKEHEISLAFLSSAAGLNERQTRRELNRLIDMNIIKVVKEATFTSSRVLAFNKYYNEWGITDKTPPVGLDQTTGDELDHSSEVGLDHTPPVGLDHQERKYLKIILKKVNDPFLRELLYQLKSINNYPFDIEKDTEFINSILVDFPTLDIKEELKKWATYKLDKPLTKKSNARSQFRNWCKKSAEWNLKKGLANP
jgi:phage replication O-like protein O